MVAASGSLFSPPPPPIMIAHTHRREIWASIDVFELESYMTPSPPPPGSLRASVRDLCGAQSRTDAQIPALVAPKTVLVGGFLVVGGALCLGNVKWRCVRCVHGSRTQRTGRKSEKRQSVFARGAGLKDTHACGILVRLASESTDSVSHTAFGDPRSSCWKQARTHARTHADAPLTGLSRRGRCCGIGGSRRTKAAVSGTSRTRTVHSTVLVSYHS